MKALDILNHITNTHPEVNGVSPPDGNQLPIEQLDPATLELSFIAGTPKAKQGEIALFVSRLDLTNIPGAYKSARQDEYREKLAQGDLNDALFKGISALAQLLKDLGVTDQQLGDAGLLPDKTQPVDTPAGWLGTVADIKERNPKA